MISRIIKVEVKVISHFIIHWRKKNGSHVLASSLTGSNTKHANLTWLPLAIIHRSHTWYDYPWPWVSLTWLLYNLQIWRHGRWFRKFTVCFRPIRKVIERSMYNNINNSNMAMRLSERTSIFGGVFFVSKSRGNWGAKEAGKNWIRQFPESPFRNCIPVPAEILLCFRFGWNLPFAKFSRFKFPIKNKRIPFD